MNANSVTRRYEKRRAWRTVVTVLASIVVFVTTYALIIPAITWERTLICEIPEHTHEEGCYTDGVLTCGLEEHTHTDACFDAPPGDENEYSCGKAEHTHTDVCCDEDGTLTCSVPEHVHSLSCLRQPLLVKAVRALTATPAPSGKAADPDTSDLLAQFITGSGTSILNNAKQNDGKVLADKSVFNLDPTGNQFDVVLSALGQSYVKNIPLEEMVHPDVVFVVDISTSMARNEAGTSNKSRLYAVTLALNNGIAQLLKQDPQTRIGIVSYSNYAWDGYRDTNGGYHSDGGAPKYFYLPLANYEYKGDNYDYVLIDNTGYGASYVNGDNTAHVWFNTDWHKIEFGSGTNTAADGSKYRIRSAVDASKTATIQGTFTQDGLMGGVRMFEGISQGDKAKREPVLILITDGEPTRFIEDDDYSKNYSNNDQKSDNNWTNKTHCGYWTVRTAMYAKRTINAMYAAAGNTHGIMFDTIGPGVTSLYGKTVVNPSPEMLDKCRTKEGAISDADGTAAYNLYKDLKLDSDLKLSDSDIQYADFADYSLTGELAPEDVKEGMNQIIASIRQIPRPVITQGGATPHLSIIDTNSLVTFIDTLGNDMELTGSPVISYGNKSFTGTAKERGTLGFNNEYTSEYAGRPYTLYRFEGTPTETSTGRALDLSKVLLYEIEATDGSTVILWQFPDELLPVVYHSPGVNPASTDDDAFIASDPLRLHMTVQPKDGKPTPGETYYTNSTDNPTTCIFTIAEDNPYYNTISGTQQNPTYTPRDRSTETNKTGNPTDTLTYSSDYNQTSRKMEVLLGNNGKLTTPLALDVLKVWDDDNPDHIASVTVKLLANGADTDKSLTLNDDNDWFGTFSDLPKYDNDGNEITYTVSEVVPTHYTVSGGEEPKTFSYDIETTTTQTVTVPAKWESATSFVNGKTYRIRIGSATGNVLKNQTSGSGQSRTYSLTTGTASNNTTTNAEKWTYSGGYLKNESSQYYLRVNQDVNAVRYNNNQDTTVSFIKNQNNNRGKIRLTRGNTSKYLVVDGSNLSVGSSGSDFALEVLNPQHTEQQSVTTTETVSGYGFVLTNTRIPLKIPVVKEWGPGTVPREITVRLYYRQNGGTTGVQKTITLNSGNNWTAELDLNGLSTNRSYFIAEVNSFGYNVSYDGATESITEGGRTFFAMRVIPGETAKVQVTNTTPAVLPSTGGHGTIPYYGIGALLIGGAMIYGCVSRRRRERRME